MATSNSLEQSLPEGFVQSQPKLGSLCHFQFNLCG